MSTTTKGGGAADSSNGGAGAGDAEAKPDASADKGTADTATSISASDHKRALDDLNKFKKEAAEARKELQTQKEAKLKEANDYKALYESEKTTRETVEKENGTFKETVFANLKLKALEAEAAKLGILPSAVGDLDVLDLASIEIETTNTGRHLVKNADRMAAQLKKSRPHWFQNSAAPKFNAGGGNKGGSGDSGDVTATDVFQAERKFKLKPSIENKTAYHSAVKKYSEQKKSAQK